MDLGPIPAVNRLLERTGVPLGDIGTIELDEAFASQSLAVLRGLGLADDDLDYAVAMLCVGGGQGAAMLLSRP